MTLDELQTVNAEQVAQVLCISEKSARGLMQKLPHIVLHQGKREALRVTVRTLERFVNGEITERESAKEAHRQGRVAGKRSKPQFPDEDKYEYYLKPGESIYRRRLRA